MQIVNFLSYFTLEQFFVCCKAVITILIFFVASADRITEKWIHLISGTRWNSKEISSFSPVVPSSLQDQLEDPDGSAVAARTRHALPTQKGLLFN